MTKIKQVDYYPFFDSILVAAETFLIKDVIGLYSLGLSYDKRVVEFKMESGATCFCFHQESDLIVTAGLDYNIRLWSPFSPEEPTFILKGHQSKVLYVFLQDNGTKIYSIDKNKVSVLYMLE